MPIYCISGGVLRLIKQGKVRDIYSLNDKQLLFVASDRLSAYDVIFPDPVPGKGVVLTSLTRWWLDQTKGIVPSHWTGNDREPLRDLIAASSGTLPVDLPKRAMIVERCDVIPFECVVRGYAYGSYLKQHPGVKPMTPFDEPLFTPSTKAIEGHDETVPFEAMRDALGETADTLRDLSIQMFRLGTDLCRRAGIILVDTKFEFGRDRNGGIKLIDECFTPDSSRFILKEDVERGVLESYDKQIVRDYVDGIGWDRTPPAPSLPREVIEKTAARYQAIEARITGAQGE